MRTGPTRKQLRDESIEVVKDPTLNKFIKWFWGFISIQKPSNQPKKKFYNNIKFAEMISNLTIEDITWKLLCDWVNEDLAFGFHCSVLLYYLLDNDLYKGEYREKLEEMKDCFYVTKKGKQDRYYLKYSCYDDIKYLIYNRFVPNRRIYLIRTDNEVLYELVKEFCLLDRRADKTSPELEPRYQFYNNIEKYLDPYVDEISSVKDFNYEIFDYMSQFAMKTDYPHGNLRRVHRFFVYLINHHSGEGVNIFKDSDPVDYVALKRDDFAKRLIEGYEFIYYNPYTDIPSSDKWILNINGFEGTSTKLKSTASKLYDFNKVDSPFYAELCKRFIWNESRYNFNTKYEWFIAIFPILNKLTSFKKKKKSSEK